MGTTFLSCFFFLIVKSFPSNPPNLSFNTIIQSSFPFDEDDLEMKFISISNWRTLDGSRHGNDPCNQVYYLVPMLDRADVPFFILGWGGEVSY